MVLSSSEMSGLRSKLSTTEDFVFDMDENPMEPERARPTKEAREWIWGKWLKFKEEMAEQVIFINQPTMTALQLKNFLKWHWTTSKKAANGNKRLGVSGESLAHYAWLLNNTHEKKCGNRLPKDQVDSIRWYCHKLVEAGGSSDSHRKAIATHTDLRILLRYLWGEDQHIYKNERMRVQLSLFIKMILYSAARPGAVVVSTCYKGSNEALMYGDVELQLLRNPENPTSEPLASLTFQFNYLKGQRLSDKFIKITLKQDKKSPAECPINDFYALADADGAWEHFASSEEIHKYRLPPGRNDYQVTFKTSVLQLPFLRLADRQGALHNTQAWTCAAAARALAALGVRAGFKDRIRPYDLRRGAANVLQMIATESELCQQMGHNSRKVFQKYLSCHVNLDLQGALTKGVAETWHIEQLRSMSKGRLPFIPKMPQEEVKEKPEEYTKGIKERDLLLSAASKLIGRRVTVREVYTPNRFRILQENLNKNLQLDDEAWKVFHDLHKVAWYLRGYREKDLRLKKEKYRADFFIKQHAKDAAYKPGKEGDEKLPTPEPVESRRELAEILFAERDILGTDTLIDLSRLLRRMCVQHEATTDDEIVDNNDEVDGTIQESVGNLSDHPSEFSFEDELSDMVEENSENLMEWTCEKSSGDGNTKHANEKDLQSSEFGFLGPAASSSRSPRPSNSKRRSQSQKGSPLRQRVDANFPKFPRPILRPQLPKKSRWKPRQQRRTRQ